MRIFKSLKGMKAKIYGWKHQPSKQEVEKLSDYYRKEVFNEEALNLITRKDFANLINVAHYAAFGLWTAIEAAFCLGYKAGKGGADNAK